MDKFRQELSSKPPPKILKDLTTTITPPKGVRRKSSENEENKTPDEGMELFDCDGDELTKETQGPKEEINEYNTDDEDIEFAIEEAAQGRI